jgi:nanoRNase/pAp phosphatase (c-di-AMP/oligoRNAs hydrolase)
MDQQTLQSFQSQLNNVTNVLIVTRPNPSFDAVSSMVSLALSFEKMQKKVTLFCPTPLTVEFGNLVGINRVQTQVGNKNLVVTLKGFAKSGVDKVSYNVEGDDFNLVVVPKTGATAFDPQNIVYNYSGVDSQMVILVDVPSLDSLGEFYQKEKDLFAKAPLVNVDASNANTNYAQCNLTNAAASSCIEITGYLLQYLKYQIDSDIATNILYGLMKATGNLVDAKVRAETYELVGMMMRMGARRVQVMQFMGQQVLSGQPVAPAVQTQTQMQMPSAPPYAAANVVPVAPQASSNANPPADWTQPKIYKGGSLV